MTARRICRPFSQLFFHERSISEDVDFREKGGKEEALFIHTFASGQKLEHHDPILWTSRSYIYMARNSEGCDVLAVHRVAGATWAVGRGERPCLTATKPVCSKNSAFLCAVQSSEGSGTGKTMKSK
jgi:hypothetical protein